MADLDITSVPYLALKKVFDELKYDDLISMLNTPMFRSVLLDYFSDDLNWIQLEKNIILECIDLLEQDLETNLFFEMISFFEKKGYISDFDFDSDPRIQSLGKEFLDKAIEFFEMNENGDFRQSYIDSQVAMLNQMKKKKQIPYDIIENFKNLSVYKFYNLRELAKEYDNELKDRKEEIEDLKVKKLKKKLFYGKSSYKNVLEYRGEVEKYIKKYLSDESSQEAVQKYRICIESKLKKLKYIFSR